MHVSKPSVLFIAMLVTIALAISQAVAQEQKTEEIEVLVRTYNVADLIRAPRDYPLDADAGRGGGPFTGYGSVTTRDKQAKPPSERAESLIRLLQELIDPESWHDNGGNLGQIKTFGTLLVIAQSEENHARIQQLLDSIRKDEGPAKVVGVQAYWVALDSEQVKTIIEDAKKDRDSAALPEVPQDLLTPRNIYWRAQIACFSGQTVHLTAGNEQPYMSDVTPVVGTNAVGYDPTIGVAQSGISMQVTPQLVPNLDVAIVDVQSVINEIAGVAEPIVLRTQVSPAATQPVTGGEGSAVVERIRTIQQEFGTTARLPLGKPCLVGGMTIQAPEGDQPGRQIYLVIEVNASE